MPDSAVTWSVVGPLPRGVTLDAVPVPIELRLSSRAVNAARDGDADLADLLLEAAIAVVGGGLTAMTEVAVQPTREGRDG